MLCSCAPTVGCLLIQVAAVVAILLFPSVDAIITTMLQQQAEPTSPTEQTLAIIKPDAVNREDDIVVRIQKAGFTISNRRKVKLSLEQAGDFYAEHSGKGFYDALTQFMSSAPIVVLTLTKISAIQDWRKLLGPDDSVKARQMDPTSIRAVYGTDHQRNACHGSESAITAEREIRFFFPNTMFQPLPSKENARGFLEAALYPVLTKGLTELCKEKPQNPTAWLGQWLINNNPNKPRVVEPEDE